MKITMTLLMLLVLSLSNAIAQGDTQWALPEGAVARFGKGDVRGIQYSPDGTRLAITTSIGVWLYDTATDREVALLTPYTRSIDRVVFSPDSTTIAGAGDESTVRLWDAETGEQKHTLAGHTGPVTCVAFSPDGPTLASGECGHDSAVVGSRDGST